MGNLMESIEGPRRAARDCEIRAVEKKQLNYEVRIYSSY
ncbi:hypothetical protein THTE_1176 [Thermogutta terrifontis]|jgi:hypothetical protein|uniref:Uncharacterized protein n=1 Tax=Thermogutta terrifontis TaxID=1331910 RepID=A0A286RCU9_9BACT|nr:hypothetical protein THTE_1176 [Thermogutta terrifontis]